MTRLPTNLVGARVDVVTAQAMAPGSPVSVNPISCESVVRVPGCATFRVSPRHGRVHVALAPDASVDQARGWLYGTVLALLLAGRRQFALHASVVKLPQGTAAIAGASGAGKSTTTLRLRQRGHDVVTDDVSPLDAIGRDVWVTPTGRPIHVWPATAAALGLDLSDARPCWPGTEKLSLLSPASERTNVQLIVILTPREGARVIARRLPTSEATVALIAQAYRSALLIEHWPAAVLGWAAAVASNLPVFTLSRPTLGWTADEVASATETLASGVSRSS
jgi:hypothetical protein